MGKYIDLTDKTFERLRVVRRVDDAVSGKRRRAKWLCECECGNTVVVFGDNLRDGKTLSCGCYQKQRASDTNSIHKETDHRLYGVWCAMKSRCTNPNVPTYHRYGGRGISVCEEWKNSYEAFRNWAYGNGYVPNRPRGEYTLDRIDNDGNYEPDNCRWVSQSDQMSNVSYNHVVEYEGRTWTIAELARRFDIPYERLYQRIHVYNYPIEKAIQK